MRKAMIVLLLIFLIIPINVFAQSTTTSAEDSLIKSFEKSVVREHFNTKKEIKDYIDKKGLEMEKIANQMIINSFDEFNSVLDNKINKFMVKIIIGIFGVVLFSNALWYFLRFKKDKKYNEIMLELEKMRDSQKSSVNTSVLNSPISVEVPKSEVNKTEVEVDDSPKKENIIFFNKEGDFVDITSFMPIANLKFNKKQILKDLKSIRSNLKPKDFKLYKEVYKTIGRL